MRAGWPAWGLMVMLSHAAPSGAATVRGIVTLPPESSDARETQWRVENGLLPVGPRSPDPRAEVVIVLEAKGGHATTREEVPAPITMELHGLRLDPRVTVVPAGTTVEFKNSDRVPHTLFVERAATLMPPIPTPAGQSRTQKFGVTGEYRIRDEEYPHIQGAVIVVGSPYFTRLDEKGGFRLEVPEGRYTLRVFCRNTWAVTQALDVGPRSTEVAIQVPSAAAAGQKR